MGMNRRTYVYLFVVLACTLGLSAAVPASAAPVIDRVSVTTKQPDGRGPTGILVSFYTNEPATSRLDYGTTASYGMFGGSSGFQTYHEVLLVSLKSKTTYHYKVTVWNQVGDSSGTLDQTFRTDQLPQLPGGLITLSDLRVRGVGGTYLIVSWLADQPCDGELQYNTVESFSKPSRAKAGKNATVHEAVATKLKLNTRYFYRVVCSDKDKNQGTLGGQSVATLLIDRTDKESLTVTDVSPVSQSDPFVSNTSVRFRFRTNHPAKGEVSWKSPVRGVKAGKQGADQFYGLDHESTVTGLKPNTTYTFSVSAKDVYGKSFTTGVLSFVTKPSAGTPPVVGTGGETDLPSCPNAQARYGACRDLAAERASASRLKQDLDKAFRGSIPAAARANWFRLVNAVTYGGYSNEAVVKAIQHGGKTVHPSIPWLAWKDSKDYQTYIKK